MNDKAIIYQFRVRILGVVGMLGLLTLSEFKTPVIEVLIITCIYVINAAFARNKLFFYKRESSHMYNLFFDVIVLSVAIIIRGGLRSDFYLGYFIILSYALVIKQKHILVKLSLWIIINYILTTVFFTVPDFFSVGRLMIRLVLISGITILLKVYVNLLSEAESKYDKAVRSAMIDPLTGVYNRKVLEYYASMFDGHDKKIFVTLIDIDDFKLVNDTYGHINGDEVLVCLANILKNKCNESGICIRYGGEEFLVINQYDQLSGIKKCIQEALNDFSMHKYTWQKDELYTFTAGVAEVKDEKDLTYYIDKADEALYCGKKRGKNTIVIDEEID